MASPDDDTIALRSLFINNTSKTKEGNRRFVLKKTFISPQLVVLNLLQKWGAWTHNTSGCNQQPFVNKNWIIHYGPRKIIRYSTNATISLDITVLCAIYSIGGPHFNNITNINNADLKAIFHYLTTKYKLKDLSGKNCVSGDGLCLMSVAKCFPNICCEMYSLGICGPMVPLNVFGKKLKSKKRAVLCPLFPMCATHVLFSRSSTNILPHLLWISYNTDPLVNTDIELDCGGNVINMYDALKRDIFSPVMKERERRTLCLRWGLINNQNIPHPFWKITRAHCMNQLSRKFGDNKYWLQVKKDMDNFHINAY